MKRSRKPEAAAGGIGEADTRLPFAIFVVFLASWFLRIPARVPPLGAISIDLLLVAVLMVFAISRLVAAREARTGVEKAVFVLVAYVIITVPLVEWPGSVAKIGLPNYVKAVMFMFFTIAFVRSERQLRILVLAFVSFQCFRVIEPVFMNVTQGYWGSRASLSGGTEFMNRLAGSPFDVVNPNGLAYVCCTILPFLYFLSGNSRRIRIAAFCVAPVVLYGLYLTGSRSGLLGLAAVCMGIVLKSKHRVALSSLLFVAALVAFSLMSGELRDRYLSAFGSGGGQNAATANERIEGTMAQIEVVYRRPLFGYGLGTSAEANYHFSRAGPYGGRPLPAHNLYLEVAQELGLIGLVIFLAFMGITIRALLQLRELRRQAGDALLLGSVTDAMQVWLLMSLIFSFFSYGLSSFDWYFFGGMAVVLARLYHQRTREPALTAPPESPAAGRRTARPRRRSRAAGAQT
jgi:O-antigen ligase